MKLTTKYLKQLIKEIVDNEETKRRKDLSYAAMLKAIKKNMTSADILLDKYKTPESMPDHIRKAYDKIRDSEEKLKAAKERYKAQDTKLKTSKEQAGRYNKAHDFLFKKIGDGWHKSARRQDQEAMKRFQDHFNNFKKLADNKEHDKVIELAGKWGWSQILSDRN